MGGFVPSSNTYTVDAEGNRCVRVCNNENTPIYVEVIGGGTGGDCVKVRTQVQNILTGTNNFSEPTLNTITDITFYDNTQDQIEIGYKVIGNSFEVCSNLDINNVTIRIEGVE